MINLASFTPLVLVDVQRGFDDASWGTRNNPLAEHVMQKLLDTWRHMTWPVFHIQHLSREPASPLRPGQEGSEFKEWVRPRNHEIILQKSVNSAFIGTDLENCLRAHNGAAVFVGLTTDHCVSTSVRMASNLGFKTYVVADATATFDRRTHDGELFTADEVHAVSLASLHGEFATVLPSSLLLRALVIS